MSFIVIECVVVCVWLGLSLSVSVFISMYERVHAVVCVHECVCVRMSTLECSTAVRWSQLVCLNTLYCGILGIWKQRVPGRTHRHSALTRNTLTYDLAWMHVHTHTRTHVHKDTDKRIYSQLHSWSFLCRDTGSRRKWACKCRIMLSGVGVEETPGFPFPHISSPALVMPTFTTWGEWCLAAACYL